MGEGVPLSLLPGTVEGALAVIDEAVAEHKPSHVFALFSGGDDSLVATHIASRHPSFSGVAHIDTTIGIEECHEYVRETCRRYGWPLIVLRPPAGSDFESFVRRYGMPAWAFHGAAYAWLKRKAIAALVGQNKIGREDRIGLVTGARRPESSRRQRTHTADRIRREGARVWINPIHDWTQADCWNYIDAERLPRSEVAANLHKSGDCLCGAFAAPDEIHLISFFYPKAAAEIRRLEGVARECGFQRESVWGWGNNTPLPKGWRQRNMPLCIGCEQRMLALDEAARP